MRQAVERAKTVKIINENSYSRKNNVCNAVRGEFRGQKRENTENEKTNKFKTGRTDKKEKECWQCGAKGHFRVECPSLVKEN